MTKQTYVKVGGVWKPCTSIWTKAGGVWKQDVMPTVRVAGVHKECMEYGQDYSPVHGNEFTWNGLTYKVIVKDYGGGVVLAWLDRHLGASRVGLTYDDSLATGYMYQYGRLEDGHEQRGTATTTTTKSTTDIPGHSDFIIASSSPYDWRATYNYNLWQGSGEAPMPPGWRLPTETEANTERLSWSSNDSDGAFASVLKWTGSGYRSGSTANVFREYRGYIWTKTLSSTQARYLYYSPDDGARMLASNRNSGCAIRCVRSDV